jgi:hypothetical protein
MGGLARLYKYTHAKTARYITYLSYKGDSKSVHKHIYTCTGTHEYILVSKYPHVHAETQNNNTYLFAGESMSSVVPSRVVL